MADQLTSFQERTEQRVRSLLSEAGRSVKSRQVLTAEVPFYSKDPEVAIKIVADGLALWLYDDGAALSTGGTSHGYERADYRDTETLADALVVDLRTAFASP